MPKNACNKKSDIEIAELKQQVLYLNKNVDEIKNILKENYVQLNKNFENINERLIKIETLKPYSMEKRIEELEKYRYWLIGAMVITSAVIMTIEKFLVSWFIRN